MKIILILVFISFSFGIYAQDTLKLHTNQGILFVEATANGKKVAFIIDCGSAHSFINDAMGKKLNFNSEPVASRIAGFGGDAGNMYRLTSPLTVTFKEISIVNGFRKSTDLTNFSKILRVEIGGLLGSDFLNFTGAVIDFKNNHLIISKARY